MPGIVRQRLERLLSCKWDVSFFIVTPLNRKDRCQYRNNLDFGARIWYTKHNLLNVPSVSAWK